MREGRGWVSVCVCEGRGWVSECECVRVRERVGEWV